MASGTLVRKVLLQIAADDGDTEAKLDAISAKAEAMKRLHPELSVRIDTAAASAKVAALRGELQDLGKSGKESGGLFSEGFSGVFSNPYVITGAIVAALAALPALAAAGGAMAGVALGAALLVGTSSVKGPLYAQFHSMTDGIMSVLRTAALPLVKPLGDAFAQIGTWAKALYPALHAVFGSLGPLVAPMTRGLEGLVSGVLPGFLRLMQAAKPAVSAVAGLMSQFGSSLGGTLGTLASGVKASSQFITGLSGIISNILPIVANLANLFAGALGPIMESIGTKFAPVLARSIDQILQRVTPLLPQISGLTGQIIGLAAQVLPLVTGPLAGLAGSLLGLAVKVLPSVIPPVEALIGQMTQLANAADRTLTVLSKIPGLGWLNPGTGGAAQLNPMSVAGTSAYSAANAAATADYGSLWAGGSTSAPTSASTAAASQAAKQQAELTTLGEQLTSAFAASLGNAKSAGAVKAGVAKLMSDVKTALTDKIITLSQDESLTKFLAGQSSQLQTLANQQGKLESEINTAKKFATTTASAVNASMDLSAVAGSGTSTLGVPALKGALSADLAAIRRFSANITKLQKMGLDKSYLSQLIAMGPVNGGELANELASSGVGDIKQINSAESAISSASTHLGQVSADAMYDTGSQAGKGFLSGLESQESAINKAMQKIAKGMVGTLRTELGIHSPSTVLHGDGVNSGLGYALGLESTVARSVQSAKKVTQAVRGAMTGQQAAAGGAAAAAQPKITIQLVGGDKAFRTWLKGQIRVTGGNVQVIGA